MALTPKGFWNASTNIPHLINGTGTTGDTYIISVGGTQDLGNGSITYLQSDSIIYTSSGKWVANHVEYTLDLATVYRSLTTLTPKGYWNPVTNTPTLANGTGTIGDFYTISISGNRDLGAGTTSYLKDDVLIYIGTGIWMSSHTLFTIDYSDVYGIADGGGTVTQINTTSPITGGPITTSGNIGITKAGSSTDGYLPSVDWNTFNNKLTSPMTTPGDIIYESSGITATRLPIGTLGQVLRVSSAGLPFWESSGTTSFAITALTGDVSATGPGNVPATIGSHKVTYAKMQQEGAFSLLGNSSGTTADTAEIGLGTGLGWSGTNIVNTAPGFTNPMNTYGDMIFETSGTTAGRLPVGTAGQLILVDSGVPSYRTMSGDITIDSEGTTTIKTGVTLISPNIGTPISGILTNCTGLPYGGISAVAWTPYSSTIVGFTGTPTQAISYVLYGKLMIIRINITGTSGGASGTLFNFTIPFNALTVETANCIKTDNGTVGAGKLSTNAGSNVIDIYTATTSTTKNTWTASGTKDVNVTISIEIA